MLSAISQDLETIHSLSTMTLNGSNVKRNRFQYFLIVLAVLSLAVVSCTRVDTSVNPQTSAVENLPLKAAHSQGIILVDLPKSGFLAKTSSSSGLITVEKGGSVSVESSAGKASISLTLSFWANSVQHNLNVSAAVDENPPSIRFDPSGTVFLKPGRLDVEAQGLDLSYLPPLADGVNHVNLICYNPETGSWEVMSAGKISVDIAKGKLECTNGIIPHFSRYAFGIVVGP